MRAGLSTIQQTLTPEAAAVLTHSIAEAARRNHGQTTPLHVAATLLSSPSSLLRQACLRSHPTSSHPLQCRALELCFSVALDRLPSNPNPNPNSDPNPNPTPNPPDPPISNALMAALKRAQAHQRRGCPEQQNQPLLAVKVELDQLIVSILDDPSVSRVMREASFSSPAVKATIEQSISNSSSSPNSPSPSAGANSGGLGLGIGARPNSARNLYVNPRLQQRQGSVGLGGGGGSGEEVRKVLEILMRTKKRNPVLVADSDPGAVMKEVLLKIERREFGVGEVPLALRSAKVVSFEKELASTAADRSQILTKIQELGIWIETQFRSGGGGGVILDLGDLKWLVEGVGGGFGALKGPGQIVSEIGRAAVAEMGKILGRFTEGGSGGGSKVWVVGTATCTTYLRCQVYHPTMESEWELQAVPISRRSPLPGFFPRLGSNGILSSSVEALAPPKGFPPVGQTPFPLRWPLENTDATQKPSLCSVCMESYERELAKLVAKEFEKSSSDSKPEARTALPQWLRMATPDSVKPSPDQIQTKEHELSWKQSIEDLLKRWRETCFRLHRNSHPPFPRQNMQPKLTISQSFTPIQMKTHAGSALSSTEQPTSPPGSPVKTDLVLGNPKPLNASPLEKAHRERIKDFPGCKQDNFSDQQRDKFSNSDADSLKRIFKGLLEKVGWQPEAASAIAGVVMQCKSGNGKRRGIGPKADTWLLFIGPDKVGKRKMAHALSELVFGGGSLITVRVGSPRTDGSDDGEESVNFRGKTPLDRVAEAVRQNPFSVIVLEDVDHADAIVRGTIKRAIERGRLPDSYGREVSLGSAIFVLTADWLPDELRSSQESLLRIEERILDSANSGRQLELSVGEKTVKRQAEWLLKEGGTRPTKPRKEPSGLGLSLDLNLAAGAGDDEPGEGSWNSSDLTVEHEQEHGRLAIKHLVAASTLAPELIDSVDGAIAFKPVDFSPLRRRISESLSSKFAAIMGKGRSIRIDDEALDQLVGGVWLSGFAAAAGFEEWAERVLLPGIERLRSNSTVSDGAVVRLSSVKGSGQPRRSSGAGDWLPSTVTVAAGDGFRGV